MLDLSSFWDLDESRNREPRYADGAEDLSAVGRGHRDRHCGFGFVDDSPDGDALDGLPILDRFKIMPAAVVSK